MKRLNLFQLKRHLLISHLVVAGGAGGDREEHSGESAGADAARLQEDGVPLTGNVSF
jgi:hypothetical protein